MKFVYLKAVFISLFSLLSLQSLIVLSKVFARLTFFFVSFYSVEIFNHFFVSHSFTPCSRAFSKTLLSFKMFFKGLSSCFGTVRVVILPLLVCIKATWVATIIYFSNHFRISGCDWTYSNRLYLSWHVIELGLQAVWYFLYSNHLCRLLLLLWLGGVLIRQIRRIGWSMGRHLR